MTVLVSSSCAALTSVVNAAMYQFWAALLLPKSVSWVVLWVTVLVVSL